MTQLSDFGEARVTVVESREYLSECCMLAKELRDIAARALALAARLDPSLPGLPALGVGNVQRSKHEIERRNADG